MYAMIIKKFTLMIFDLVEFIYESDLFMTLLNSKLAKTLL